MAAEEPPALREPRNVNEAREILALVLQVPLDKVAEHSGLTEEAFVRDVRRAIAASLDQKGPFLFHWARILARREYEEERRAFRRSMGEGGPSPPTPEATPVADQTNDDLTALGREVSGLNAKVNILMGVAGGSAVLIIGGALTLWQAIGGVETRVIRELGQAENRVIQQIADVRSEVGEIRGRLSAQGQAQPAPPR